MMPPVILASASPRRQEILELAGVPFEVFPADGEEAPAELPARAYALALAKGKATAVAARFPDRVVLGADTVVVRDGTVLGKPKNEADAVEMLLSLQGRTHRVITAVYVCTPQQSDGFAEETTVEFYPMTRAEAQAYVATGEPMDKAGSYAIQGRGMRFVKRIEGDFYTVMGLPGAATRRFLDKFSAFSDETAEKSAKKA